MTFEIFARRTLLGRRWFWRLVAGNGRTVAQSEGYSRRIDALATISAVRHGAHNAQLRESGR